LEKEKQKVERLLFPILIAGIFELITFGFFYFFKLQALLPDLPALLLSRWFRRTVITNTPFNTYASPGEIKAIITRTCYLNTPSKTKTYF